MLATITAVSFEHLPHLQVSSEVVVAFAIVPVLFILAVLIVIAVVAATRGMSSRGRIQRPTSESTAFPPPPPPDTVTVKCQYCGAEQTWKETCIQCGAPLPRPVFG